MVLHRPPSSTCKRPGLQLHRHKRFCWHVVLAPEPKLLGRLKAKTGIVPRMAQDHDNLGAPLLAGLKPLAYQHRADASPLVLGKYSHGRQSHRSNRSPCRFQFNGAKEDMPDDLALRLGYERQLWIRCAPQGIDELGLGYLPKGALIDLVDGEVIRRGFRSDSNPR